MNLLTNAAEAMEQDGGTLTISTGQTSLSDEPGRLTHDALEPGDYVFLEVEDTGGGMDTATQSRIFDPFFTTKFTGRGLGLASVIGILRAHHGSVEIDSRLGRGSRIRVLLPVSELTGVAQSNAPEARTGSSDAALVLVIDDDQDTREVTQDCLTRAGLRVLCAPDGQSGVELFREHANEIELVLLDRTMPVLSGEDTFELIREIRGGVKILLMSGYAGKQAAESFAGKGLSGFVGKPFLPEDLVDQVHSALTVAAR